MDVSENYGTSGCLRGGTESVASCDRYSRENQISARDLRLSDEANRRRYTSCVSLTLSSRPFLIALSWNRNLHSRRLDHLSRLLALSVLCFDRLNCQASSSLPEHGSQNSFLSRINNEISSNALRSVLFRCVSFQSLGNARTLLHVPRRTSPSLGALCAQGQCRNCYASSLFVR